MTTRAAQRPVTADCGDSRDVLTVGMTWPVTVFGGRMPEWRFEMTITSDLTGVSGSVGHVHHLPRYGRRPHPRTSGDFLSDRGDTGRRCTQTRLWRVVMSPFP